MGWSVSKELERKILEQAVSINGVAVVQVSTPAAKPKKAGKPRKLPAGPPPVANSVHVLWLPGYEPSALNKKLWKHWSVAGRAQKADKAAIQAAVLRCGTPKAARPRSVALYMALGPRKRGLDPDSVWKGLLDGLRASGALVDDSPAWCRIEGPYYLKCLHGAPAGSFVILTDL